MLSERQNMNLELFAFPLSVGQSAWSDPSEKPETVVWLFRFDH